MRVTQASAGGADPEAWVNMALVTRMVKVKQGDGADKTMLDKTMLVFLAMEATQGGAGMRVANQMRNDTMIVEESFDEIEGRMRNQKPVQHDNMAAFAQAWQNEGTRRR